MRKRAAGEGTGPYWSEARQKWVVQLPPGPDGRRPLRTADTEAEALAHKKQLEAERAAGRDPSRKAETVDALLDAHLETIEAQGRRASTILGYCRSCNHIRRRIGAMKVGDVSHEVVQSTANAMARTMGATAVREALERLRAAYEPAVPDRVPRNPVDFKKLKLRRHAPAQRHPLDDAQVATLLADVDNADILGRYIRYGVGVWLMALLGLRRGEASGATWSDVSWARGEIKVRQQLALSLEGGYAPGEIKTSAGMRVLSLGPRLQARLQEEWEHRQRERKRPGWKEHGFILAHEDGSAVRPDFINHVLNMLDGRPGEPHVHPHLLRHTVATLISEEGYSEAVIAGVLGHSKGGNVTRHYTHATEKTKRNAVLSVETRIFGPVAEGQKEAL